MALTLKAMEYFTTALRHGNIAKAAAELNIAASAISTAIAQVETEFDLTLVSRHRARGIQANASGREVARKCEHLLDEYRAVLAEGTDLKKSLSGTLRIGYYAPIAPAFLPQIFESFLPNGSAVTLDLEECDNYQAQDGLLAGHYDAILFVAEDVRLAIDYDPLIAAPPFCLLPEAHPLAQHASVSIAQLAQEELVVLNRPVAAPYYERLFRSGSQQGSMALSVTAPAVTYANSTEMVRSFVAAGRGCAIVNMRPLTTTAYCGAQLVERPISDVLPPLTLAVGYDKKRPRRIVEDFAKACRAHFAEPGPTQCILQS